MENKEFFEGIRYEGYYDENRKLHIDISKEDAEEVLARLTGAEVKIGE